MLLQVGKSYGNLGSKDREKYEIKNCNAVAKGVNPSCDDVRQRCFSKVQLRACSVFMRSISHVRRGVML